MQERRYFTCDIESARDGDVQIEEMVRGMFQDIEQIFFPDLEDGVIDEHEYIFEDGGFYVIWAASEEHAEQLVREHINAEE